MIRKVSLFYVLYLVLAITSSAVLPRHVWGLSSWVAVSMTLGLVLALVALLLTGRKANEASQRLIPPGIVDNRYWAALFLAAAAVIMFIFRSGHDLWGERHGVAAILEAGVWTRPGAPLGMILNDLVFRFLNTVFLMSPSQATTFLSITCGVLFISAAAWAARLVAGARGGDGRQTALCTLFITAGGYAALFFGAGGNTAPAVLFAILFIIASLIHIRGRADLSIPALLLVIAVMVHQSSIYLFAGFIILLVRAAASPGHRMEALRSAAVIVVLWGAAELALPAVTETQGPSGNLVSSLVGALRLLFSQEVGRPLADWANALLLMGPAPLVALAVMIPGAGTTAGSSGRTEKAEEGFLAALVLAAATATLLGAGRVDGGLRWDVFAATAPAFALFSLWGLSNRLPDAKDFRHAVTLLAALGIFHAVPVITAGHSIERGETRMLTLPLEEGENEKIIGIRMLERNEYVKAADWLGLSVEKNPGDDYAWYALGLIDMQKEEYLDAVTHFNRAAELKPENRLYRENLGEAYIGQMWWQEAAYEFEQLALEDPFEVRYWLRLGYARNHGGKFEEAIQAYERALSFDPEDQQYQKNLVSALLNRGAELQKDGLAEDASRYYYRAISIYPLDWVAYNNLAIIAMDSGDPEKAYDILESALRRHPMSSKLHFNMGLVEEELGNYEKALEHLKKSAELNPAAPPPNDHLARVMRKIEEEGEKE